MLFRNIDVAALPPGQVVLDLDGTLVLDGAEEVGAEESRALECLTRERAVFLVTNKGGKRAAQIAERAGVVYIQHDSKKPDPRIARLLPGATERVVLGDKVLTDGLFAFLTGARFVQITPLRAETERLSTRVLYAVDASMARIVAYVTLMRPQQWVKNGLMFGPLFFAGLVGETALLLQACVAFLSFSAAASAGYIYNDMRDVLADRAHPTKRFRPLARGSVQVREALVLIALLASASFGLALVVPSVLPWLGLYGAATFAYSAYVKHVPVLEFVWVAALYVVRVLAGGVAVNVAVTDWLVSVIFFSTLFVTVGRRYAEHGTVRARAVLEQYPQSFMAALPPLTAGLLLVSYVLYAIIASQYEHFVYSSVFVVFAVLWYLRGIYRKEGVEHPDTKLWKDGMLLVTVCAWTAYSWFVIYIV